MTFANLRFQSLLVLATLAMFAITLALNTWLFKAWFEHMPGIAWVYLPAGVRLLSTLLFAHAGAIGMLIGGLVVNFLYFYPDDSGKAFFGAVSGALAPYLTYLYARHAWGLQASLVNLSAGRLLVLSVMYSIASPLMHHLYFAWRGQEDLANGFLAMFTGDLLGTLIVLYAMKWALSHFGPGPAGRGSRSP